MVGAVELTESQREAAIIVFDEVAGDSPTLATDKIPQAVQSLIGNDPDINALATALRGLKTENGGVTLSQFEGVVGRYLLNVSHWGRLTIKAPAGVGIQSIPQQIQEAKQKHGVQFNIMVVGRAGLGKSTLVNTLFKSSVSRLQGEKRRTIPETPEIHTVTHLIEESGVKLRLSITDTPGFGDHVDNNNCWQLIQQYIEQQYDKYFSEETAIDRKKRIPDHRVHCLLYFVTPTGHNLKELDIKAMQALSQIVNVVPLIAKADSFTVEEREAFKDRITEDIDANEITVFPNDVDDDERDDDRAAADDKLRDVMPFAVVGSEDTANVKGKSVLARQTKFGAVEVENPDHNDFPRLRDMLLKTHTYSLIDGTHNLYYANHRANKLRHSTSDV